VLDSADGPSSLAASISTIVELLEGRIDVAATIGVCWGSRFVLVAIVLHFLELKPELEDEADALWTWVHAASDSLALYVASSVARGPPDGTRE
jgi:hypothetical protein